MEIAWIGAALIVPICFVIWKQQLSNDMRSLIHGLLVVFGATISTGAYVSLKTKLDNDLGIYDKFWISLPLLTSVAATGRCMLGRFVTLWFKRIGRSNGKRRTNSKE